MKTFIVFILLIALPFMGKAIEKPDTFRVEVQDFAVTYLGAKLTKNPFLDKKLGWGLLFSSQIIDGQTYITADGFYFDNKEIKEVEAAQKAAQIIFDDFTYRYSLKEKLKFKKKITQVRSTN